MRLGYPIVTASRDNLAWDSIGESIGLSEGWVGLLREPLQRQSSQGTGVLYYKKIN